MPKFDVILTRDTTESVVVTVDADTMEGAEIAAITNLWHDEEPPQWETDDNLPSEVYATSIELLTCTERNAK